MKEKILYTSYIITLTCLWITVFIAMGGYYKSKIEHEKTIQKAIECGYQPLCIGGDYWNKGD